MNANIVIVMPMTMSREFRRTCRVCIVPHTASGIHFMKAILRAYLSNQDINGGKRGGGRFRSMITASTIFCFACNVIDYRPTENAPRFNCLDCHGKRFSSFISHCGRKTQSDITFRIHYRSNVKNNRLQI